MMEIFKYAIYVLSMIVSVSIAKAGMISLDPITDSGFVTENLSVVTNSVNTGLIEKAQNKIKNAKAKYAEYKGFYEGVYNKDKAPLDGSKIIQESTVADISDEDSVRKAIYNLFMVYPSDNEYERANYSTKAEQFYQDTVVETYTAVRSVEEDFNKNIKPRIEKMTEDLLSGENGASNTDDENGSWKNTYNAYKTFDDLLQVLEELTAIKAQFEAAKAIKNNIKPVTATYSKGTKTSLEKSNQTFAQTSHEETIAFAQISEGTYSYRYDPDKDSPVSYREAPKPDIDSPFAANRGVLEDLKKINPIYYKALYALKIHNLLQKLPTQRQQFKKYEQFVRLHEKSVEAVKQSDKCVIDYLGRYYEDPENLWYGRYIGDQITDYDLREGLSGWSIAAYDTAKAAISDGEIDANLFSELQYSDNIDSDKVSSIQAQEEDVKKTTENKTGFVSTDDEKKAKEENREEEVVAWNIGSEATKQLVEDQYTNKNRWGIPIKKFPIWNDIKSYYGQYIDGKYENIKSYLDRLNFDAKAIEIAKILNTLSIANMNFKVYAKAQLAILEHKVKDTPEIDIAEMKTIENLQEEKQEKIRVLQQNKADALKELKNNKRVKEQQLDNTNKELNNNTKILNRIKYPEVNGNEETPNIKKEEVEVKITQQEQKVEQLKNQINLLDKKISEIEKAYIEKEQTIENNYTSEILNFENKIKEKRYNGIEIGNLITSTPTLIGEWEYFNNIISQTNTIIAQTKDYALQKIEETKASLYNLGDELYLPTSKNKIVEIHKRLIQDLQKMSIEDMIKTYSSMKTISSNTQAATIISEFFQKAIVSSICIEYECDKADEEYFVGSYGKSRDFMAPKVAPYEYLGPIREMIHLDYVDYNNIPHTREGGVSKQGILNYGFTMPKIWSLILRNPAYVEKNIDLSKLLSLGGEQKNFMRGGILPCRSGNFIIDALSQKAGYYVVQNEKTAYKECLALEAKKETNKIITGMIGGAFGGLMNVSILNKQINKSVSAEYASEIQNNRSSELGTFLKYSNNKLYFGNIEEQAYKRITEVMEGNYEGTYEENITDDIYQKATFSENQIGNFLKFMETEREYRQTIDEMKIKIDELQEEVIEELKKAGFVPNETFNLGNDSDYTEAVKILNNSKNAILTETYSDIENLKNPTNNVVNVQISEIRNMLDSMNKDKDELIQLSEATINDSELDEQIKSEEVNRVASEKYQTEADKEFEKMINNFEIPYCAAY